MYNRKKIFFIEMQGSETNILRKKKKIEICFELIRERYFIIKKNYKIIFDINILIFKLLSVK